MITGVSVEGLFGTFSHDVEFNIQESVTILSAPNGYGKSTLLRMIKAVGEGAFGDLAQVPFETFAVRDDQGPALVFSREVIEKDGSADERDAEREMIFEQELARSWRDADGRELSPDYTRAELTAHLEGTQPKRASLGIFPVPGDGPSPFVVSPAQVEARMRHSSSRAEYEHWRSLRDTTRPRSRASARQSTHADTPPDWLQDRLENMKVLLIESQRLLEPEPVGPGRSRPDGQHTTIPAVTAISNDLVGRIGKDKIAYVRQSGEIDRTFPIRFLKAAADTQQAQSASELRARLSELDKKRADLQAVGILEREELLALEIPDEIEDVYVKAFSLLVSDIDHKLNHFDELESKISLLKELANARFQYKKLEVDAERGLYCVAEGRNVPLVQLSSGEQHELVLFYDALFRVEEGSLLMIDEPELSLHAAWQSEFIEDLKRILRLSGVTVLIATHSSALIGGNWDLVVELKGPSSGLHS